MLKKKKGTFCDQGCMFASFDTKIICNTKLKPGILLETLFFLELLFYKLTLMYTQHPSDPRKDGYKVEIFLFEVMAYTEFWSWVTENIIW